MEPKTLKNEKELEFVVFCIENIAASLSAEPESVYSALLKSGILYDYIVPNYDVLRTQGKDYIVNDFLSVMRREDVSDMHCMSDDYLAEELAGEYIGSREK